MPKLESMDPAVMQSTTRQLVFAKESIHPTCLLQDSVLSEWPMILIPGGETSDRFGRVLQLIESEIEEKSSGIDVMFSDAEGEKTIITRSWQT